MVMCVSLLVRAGVRAGADRRGRPGPADALRLSNGSVERAGAVHDCAVRARRPTAAGGARPLSRRCRVEPAAPGYRGGMTAHVFSLVPAAYVILLRESGRRPEVLLQL